MTVTPVVYNSLSFMDILYYIWLFCVMFCVGYVIPNIVWGIICYFVVKSKGYSKGGFLWGFFLGLIGLIVCLCKPDIKNQQIIPKVKPKMENKVNSNNNVEQIREYKKLLDDGIITEEDFNKKKQELLGV